VLRCRAVLFDLDGVLVDSRACLAAVWRAWARPLGLDPETFLAIAQGRQTSETVRLVAPHLDARAESARLDALEETETVGLAAFPGAADLLRTLGPEHCAVVTSCTRPVATLRLATAGLSAPPIVVTADDVRRAKPDPAPYLLAADLLHFAPADCVVVEDSPTGLAAARAAGMRAIAVLTTHPAAALAAADAIAPDLASLRAGAAAAGRLNVTLAASAVR
jgi:mannitol-1-/sugar-/sorbitol-6-phosphatase